MQKTSMLSFFLKFCTILFIGITFIACKTYKQSFKKKQITNTPVYERSSERDHSESKFTTYDASNMTIGNLEWKGKYWDKIYEYGKDPMFKHSYPWDQEGYPEENVKLTDSCIEIWARTDGTNGVLFSNFKFKYGIVKALVKLPDVDGAWSAFWLFRGMPELDIFEHCGQWENQVSVTHHWGYSYEKGMKKTTYGNVRYNENFEPTKKYYVYEVEVTPYEVIYRINGIVTQVLTEGVPSHEQHIILNVTTGDYCENIALKEDAVMKVKWIKVFEMP